MDLRHSHNYASMWLKPCFVRIPPAVSNGFSAKLATTVTCRHQFLFPYMASILFSSHPRHFKIPSTKAPPQDPTNSQTIFLMRISIAWFNDQAQLALRTRHQIASFARVQPQIARHGRHAFFLAFFKILACPVKPILEWSEVLRQATTNRWFRILIRAPLQHSLFKTKTILAPSPSAH